MASSRFLVRMPTSAGDVSYRSLDLALDWMVRRLRRSTQLRVERVTSGSTSREIRADCEKASAWHADQRRTCSGRSTSAAALQVSGV